MDKGEEKLSPMEYHFNVPWVVEIEHKNDNLAVWLYCKRESDIPWFVQCALQIEIVHPSGKTKSKVETKVFGSKNGSVRGWYHFMKWEKMKKKYLDKDQLTVVVNGTINQIIGIP
uniref:MATH domain-containing protein n=1 Tax=Caenorhabditis tropicalis TaxID=1561998 RepID=A0A1I7UTV7_9PELO